MGGDVFARDAIVRALCINPW